MSKRTKQNVSRKRPPKRRPNPVHRRVTPAVLDRFSDLWLQGTSVAQIARTTGFNRKTVTHHIEHTITPLWQREQVVKLEVQLARVEHLYYIAWTMFEKSTEPLTRQTVKDVLFENGVASGVIKRVTTTVFRTGEVSWLKTITWCLDHVAKISGLYVQGRARAHAEPSRPGRQDDYEMRVAGQSPAEFDQETLKMILQEMEKRKNYEEGVKARQIEHDVPMP